MNKLRTVIVGFGNMADGYVDDPVMAAAYRYCTHAQVLSEHPHFEWGAVVDPSSVARDRAKDKWGIRYAVESPEELCNRYEPEVAVLATPPEFRNGIISKLKFLKAVIVEKPLGIDYQHSMEFISECDQRAILVQVNFWRRADDIFRRLAAGYLQELVGEIQCAFGIYGNGIINNGSHMIDFIRMLMGEIENTESVSGAEVFQEGPIPEDVNPPFVLKMKSGVCVMVHPVRFGYFRENGIDIWGSNGRLSIMHEGLTILYYPKSRNRGLSDAFEIGSDQPIHIDSTVGEALYRVYDNLADTLRHGGPLWSPGSSALKTERVIDGILNSIHD